MNFNRKAFKEKNHKIKKRFKVSHGNLIRHGTKALAVRPCGFFKVRQD